MTEHHQAQCPECDAGLEDGYIGFFSGIMWHDQPVTGLLRLFPFVLSAASFIISNLISTPWIRSRQARRCRSCGTLIVPSSSMPPNQL